MVSPKVCQVPCTIPAAHQIDIPPLCIDAHLVASSVPRAFLHMCLVRMVMVVKSLAMTVRSKSLPDWLVVI